MIRCKFKVTENSSGTVRMEPVTGGSPENVKFFTSTPAGRFDLHFTNPDLTGDLCLGSEVFIDVHLAPRPQPEPEEQPAPQSQPTPTAAEPVAAPKAVRKSRRGGKAEPAV